MSRKDFSLGNKNPAPEDEEAGRFTDLRHREPTLNGEEGNDDKANGNGNGVELQGYVRRDVAFDSPGNNNHAADSNGGNTQQLNPAFVGDTDISSTTSVSNGDTPKATEGSLRPVRDSMVSLTSTTNFDDSYTDESGVGLIYSHHERVAFKNFSAEVRATVDVKRFLANTYLVLHLHKSDPDEIVDILLEKMLHDVKDGKVMEQAKGSIFTHDKMHQMSRTIQGTALFTGDMLDYDQNWICAMCSLPAINEARVGIVTLSTPTNLQRNCQDCRFIVLILTPAKVKGTKNEYEKARTFSTLFADLDFRNQLLDARTETDFKELVASNAKALAQKHSDARLAEAKEEEKAKVKCGFMKGLIGDLRRRLPHYVADYKDGLCDKKSISKSLSCTMFLYFACILPCIAFGVLNESNTKGVLTVEKVLYSQTFGGLIFALIGGTPQIVLLTTAPLAIYSKIIYNISEDFDLNFPAMYACVGLWNAFFLILYSIFDLSILMQFSTRSSEEIFALFISIAFSVDAFKNTASNFAKYYNAEICDTGYNKTAALLALNSTASDDTLSDLLTCKREISVLYLLLLLGTAWVGVMLYNFTRTPYLTAGKREILADYSLPIAVVIMAFVGSFLFDDVEIGKSFDPNARTGALFELVDFSTLSVGAIFGAMGLGFCLSLLFFMDQNISAALVNAPQNKMKKGTAYHWDILVIAVVNAVISVFAFPMVHAALPHSPLHVRALADVEERVVQGHITQTVVRVRETRVTAVISHVLIGVSIFIMFVLAYIPTPVLYGLFLYVAITALYDNQMFERITLLFTEQSAYPPNHYIRHVPQKKVHIFTLLQCLQLGVLCIFGFVDFSYLKMFFPVLIFFLIPIRHKLIPKIVERKYIDAIDHSH
ncbi:solute carrier family 4 member 11-like [Littorina saxatilis]|uniref:solute carrier family 4 member 11-like n=1 Tax=Littorina saxatilis TaxID=31220 RepID=UPI0038B67694